jgi:hypothetical protein
MQNKINQLINKRKKTMNKKNKKEEISQSSADIQKYEMNKVFEQLREYPFYNKVITNETTTTWRISSTLTMTIQSNYDGVIRIIENLFEDEEPLTYVITNQDEILDTIKTVINHAFQDVEMPAFELADALEDIKNIIKYKESAKTDLRMKQTIVFAILMEGNGGIMNKAPRYIKEKLNIFNMEDPEALLDYINLEKYNEYINKWM